jgi:hypothetical protein
MAGCPASLWAQTSTWQQPDNWLLSEPSRYTVKGVKGSPTLFEDYLDAVIFMKKGDKIDEVKVNLLNEDDMVVSRPYKGVEALYDIEENDIRQFIVTGTDGKQKTFLRLDQTLFSSSVMKSGFYETLSKNEAFIKRAYKELKKAEKVGGYSSGPDRDEYVLIEQYYLRLPGEAKYQEIKLSKKSVTRMLGNKAAEAKSLMKQNGWKWKDESHVRMLIEAVLWPE